MNKSLEALNAIKERYSNVEPSVTALSDEQKAWLEYKIQIASEGIYRNRNIENLKKINKSLRTATDDINDSDLQKMVSFIFNNMNEINTLLAQENSNE